MSRPRPNRKREMQALERRAALHWKNVLDTDSGRFVLLELMTKYSVFRTLPIDPQSLQRSAGFQSAGHYILERVADVAPERLAPMLAQPYLDHQRERLEREAEEAARKRDKESGGNTPNE